MTRRLLPGFLLLVLLLLCVPGSAAAAPWTCEASGVRAALGPAPPIEPITANSGASECLTQSAGGALSGLPMGATGSLLFARTRADGDASRPAAQRVSAESGLADLHIPLLPGLPGLPLPTPPVIDVPGFGSIDLGPAVRAAAAPQGDLLGLRALTAEVVKRFKPRRNGHFRVRLQGAEQRQVATFRFRTKVRFRVGNPRLFRTFTLPQYVDIG